jgi:hypothetical protein
MVKTARQPEGEIMYMCEQGQLDKGQANVMVKTVRAHTLFCRLCDGLSRTSRHYDPCEEQTTTTCTKMSTSTSSDGYPGSLPGRHGNTIYKSRCIEQKSHCDLPSFGSKHRFQLLPLRCTSKIQEAWHSLCQRFLLFFVCQLVYV